MRMKAFVAAAAAAVAVAVIEIAGAYTEMLL
jgi:hypothetical protein